MFSDRFTVKIGHVLAQIVDVECFAGADRASHWKIRTWIDDVTQLELFTICSWGPVRCRNLEPTIFAQPQISEFGAANSRRIFKDRLKNRLKLPGRPRHHLQNFRSCGVLLERLAEIVCSLAKLVEQPRVLNGNNGLLRKVGDQFDLFVGERANLLPEDSNGANEFVVLEHWNDEKCPYADNFHSDDDPRITLQILLFLAQIGNMYNLSCFGGPHNWSIFAWPKRSALNEFSKRVR